MINVTYEIHSRIYQPVYDQVYDQVYDKVGWKVRSKVLDEVYSGAVGKVFFPVKATVKQDFKDKIR
jgi:hypothetical protein